VYSAKCASTILATLQGLQNVRVLVLIRHIGPHISVLTQSGSLHPHPNWLQNCPIPGGFSYTKRRTSGESNPKRIYLQHLTAMLQIDSSVCTHTVQVDNVLP